MARANDNVLFVPMKSIEKKPTFWEDRCANWIATEKIHGSSFQFYTKDGQTIHVGSRRHCLDGNQGFLKCNIIELKQRYGPYVTRLFQAVIDTDRWSTYKTEWADDEEEDVDDDVNKRDEFEEVKGREEQEKKAGDEEEKEESVKSETTSNGLEKCSGNPDEEIVKQRISRTEERDEDDRSGKVINHHQTTDPEDKIDKADENSKFEEVDQNAAAEQAAFNGNQGTERANAYRGKLIPTDDVTVRIYGELYGGGGIEKDVRPAVQKEILYSDDFRFYVFGITINQKWVTIAELNDLCQIAGFPYYAKPVCEPKETRKDLVDWLTTSGFMTSRSKYTERADDFKTGIEGVVMSPMTRPDFRLHAIKLLSDAFTDVRPNNKNKKGGTQKPNYCTKARYNSVISKLDIPERENAQLVVDMYIEDVLEESGETNLSNNKRKGWTKMVKTWLVKDGYISREEIESTGPEKRTKKSATPSEVEKSIDTASEVEKSASISNEAAASGIEAKTAHEVEQSALSANGVEESAKPTNEIEESAKPEKEVEESAKPTNEIEESAKPTNEVEESAKPEKEAEESAKLTNEVEKSAKPTRRGCYIL